MSTNARQGWNAAQRAAERELQKPRELHPTVGVGGTPINPTDPRLVLEMRDGASKTCRACGFHVHAPTCPTQKPKKSIAAKIAERRMEQITLHAPHGEQQRPFPPPPAVSGQRSGKTLTLLEAAAACHEGKIVRKVVNRQGEPEYERVEFRYSSERGFEIWAGWEPCWKPVNDDGFPSYSLGFSDGSIENMRFEVVS